MRFISTLFDSEFRHVSVFNPVPPLSAEDVIGQYAWRWATPTQATLIRTRLAICLATGKPQAYRVFADVEPTSYLFLVRVQRAVIGTETLLHCIATQVPPAVHYLAEADVGFLCLLAVAESQAEIAAELGISQSAVSRRERRLRTELGVESRYELRLIGRELLEERNAQD